MVLGLFSGIFSFVFVSGTGFFPTLYFVPGIMFGFFLLLGIYIFKIPQLKFSTAFVIFSTLGYLIAVFTTLGLIVTIEAFAFLIGGLIGTFIMLIGFAAFIKRLVVGDFIALTVIGGVLALSWYILPSGTFFPKDAWDIFRQDSFFSLYVVWQTGMMFLLGLYLPDSTKKK